MGDDAGNVHVLDGDDIAEFTDIDGDEVVLVGGCVVCGDESELGGGGTHFLRRPAIGVCRQGG